MKEFKIERILKKFGFYSSWWWSRLTAWLDSCLGVEGSIGVNTVLFVPLHFLRTATLTSCLSAVMAIL